MKKIALLLAGLGFCMLSPAEEPVRNFYFAGYKAIFIPSDTFRVEVENPDSGSKKRNLVVHTQRHERANAERGGSHLYQGCSKNQHDLF